MFKSPRRNGRNKGLKIKHVIQISMLLGVSIWLLYQIHHSDDKKSSVTIKVSHKLNNDSSGDISKLGRKVLRPKGKETKEHHRVDDEQKNEINEGSEDGEDHESEEHEEVGESEHADGKEDGEEIKEHENEKENDEEIKGKLNVNTRNEQNQVAVKENIEKEMSPISEDDDGDDGQSVRGEVENDKMMKSGEDDTSSSKQPSVDHNGHNSKMQTEENIDAAPDSYMKSTGNEKNMKAGSDSEAQSKKDGVPMLEEEKDAVTDLETLPESGPGGSISLQNAAKE